MNVWEYISRWGWPILWLVFALSFIDAWYDHRELSEKIKSALPKDRNRAIRKRLLSWTIPILAFIGAVVAQIGADISDKKIAALEAKQAPRTITEKQRNDLKEALSGTAVGPIEITSYWGDAESKQFAEQIKQSLIDCGFNISESSEGGGFKQVPKGIIFLVKNSYNTPPHANSIPSAFQKAGIPFTATVESKLENETVLYIIVGVKP